MNLNEANSSADAIRTCMLRYVEGTSTLSEAARELAAFVRHFRSRILESLMEKQPAFTEPLLGQDGEMTPLWPPRHGMSRAEENRAEEVWKEAMRLLSIE